jgi:hypothetical protein
VYFCSFFIHSSPSVFSLLFLLDFILTIFLFSLLIDPYLLPFLVNHKTFAYTWRAEFVQALILLS